MSHPHHRVDYLTKGPFLSGWHCLRRLWLDVHRPDLLPPLNEVEEARIETGRRVGELARERFKGTLLFTPNQSFDAAVKGTQHLLDDPSVSAPCEAAFLHDGVAVRTDILTRNGRAGWDLIEVKSTSSAKDEHVLDVAIQLHVLRGTGLHVENACLLHINGDYVYEGGAYDLEELFSLVDVTDEIEEVLPEIPPALAEMKALKISKTQRNHKHYNLRKALCTLPD